MIGPSRSPKLLTGLSIGTNRLTRPRQMGHFGFHENNSTCATNHLWFAVSYCSATFSRKHGVELRDSLANLSRQAGQLMAGQQDS